MSQLLIEAQCFPPISFFVAALSKGQLLIEACENYVKGSYRNRYHIAGPNGFQRLSIPLAGGKHQQQPIRLVQIASMDDWQNTHWRSIKTAYGKSPFFIHYEEEIKTQIYSSETSLFQWNLDALKLIIDLLGIDLPLFLTTTYDCQLPAEIEDARNLISPKKEAFSANLVQYQQVFQEKSGFLNDLSILDLIFCKGPQAAILLLKAASK